MKGIRPVKNWVVGDGVVICLERGTDLHMAQLMPLPHTVSCVSKIQIGFTFLVPDHPGSPGKRAVKRVCVCVCVSALCTARWERFAVHQDGTHRTTRSRSDWSLRAAYCGQLLISSSSSSSSSRGSPNVDYVESRATQFLFHLIFFSFSIDFQNAFLFRRSWISCLAMTMIILVKWWIKLETADWLA